MSLVGPARTVLEEAEKQNRTLGHENLGFLSAEYGLMPIAPPLLSLPKSHQAWDDVIALLPHLYKRVSIRRALNELPLLSGAEESLDDRYLYRANTLLGILQQAYYRCEFGIPETIPLAIQQPLKEIATRLQRPHPGLTLNDVTICNWRFKDPSKTERTLQNMSLLFDIFSLPEDENFNLIITELYAVSAPLIMSFIKAQEAMLAEDDIALQQELFLIIDTMKKLMSTMEKMQFPKYALATFNPIVWAKTSGYFSMPLGDRSPRLSGGATSFIHLLDAFTGRKQYNSKLGIIEKRLIYLADSVHLKNFLKAIESVPLNEYLAKRQNKELSATVMSFMDLYAGKRGFLRRHRHKVYGFLESAVKMGMSMTAGGFEVKDVFLQKSWRKIDAALKASEKEHLESVPCRYPLVSSLGTAKENKNSPLSTIKFDLKHSGLNYGKGDYLDLLILNDDSIVEELITLFEVSADHFIYLTAYWREWLKRFDSYDDVEESISIKRFLQLAKLYPLSKESLQSIYVLTKLEKVGALLTQENALNLNLLEVLKIIKEETAYNIQRFIYAEEWRPENISKWLSHTSCRTTYSFEDNKEIYSIASLQRNMQQINFDNKSQNEFYLSIKHAVRFNTYKKETPLVILAADEGMAPFITIINDALSQKKHKPVYLFVVLSDFFSDERIAAIKQWLSTSISLLWIKICNYLTVIVNTFF